MEKEVSGKTNKTFYDYVLSHLGKEEAGSVLRDLPFFNGRPYDEMSLIDEHRWFSTRITKEIFERANQYFHDDKLSYKIQVEAMQKREYGHLDFLMRIFSPSLAVFYHKFPLIVKDNFCKIYVSKVTDAGKNQIIFENRIQSDIFMIKESTCQTTRGGLEYLPTFIGYDKASVVETECSVPIEHKGLIGFKFYRVNEKREVLEFNKGDDEKTAAGKVIGTLSPDGTFKLDGVVYGAKNCVYHVSWHDKSLWARTFGQLFNRETTLQLTLKKLEEEKILLEQKYDEIDQLNAGLEEKILRRTQELENSNKLKDLFISIMEHDINNYLTSVLGYALLLKQTGEGNVQQYGQIIAENAVKINELISSARLFSRLQDPELKKIFKRLDLRQIVETIVADLGPKAAQQKKHFIVGAISESASFDGLSLASEIFSNLIDNAVKYSNPGTRIELSVEEQPDSFIFAVKDNGREIADKYKTAIFDRFERLECQEKEGVEGSGLGLAIVKLLVRLHGGLVWVEDNPEGGAIFKVKLAKSRAGGL
ncbi:MAG: HAMP domain-containing sensor histidine kinase [Candidatus Margulisiibacteriota bacterium]|jgi:signal transduction histidine kinase